VGRVGQTDGLASTAISRPVQSTDQTNLTDKTDQTNLTDQANQANLTDQTNLTYQAYPALFI